MPLQVANGAQRPLPEVRNAKRHELDQIIAEVESQGRRRRATPESRAVAQRLRSDLHTIDRAALPLDDRIDYDVVDLMLFARLPTYIEGKLDYRYAARRNTTLNLTPDQLHEIGLEEVERIRGDMVAVMRRTGFDGDLADFFGFLREDDRFYPRSRDELRVEARRIGATIEERLPQLFRALPTTPFVIEIASGDSRNEVSAYYGGISSRGGNGLVGRVVINGADLERRPAWGLEALIFHEAVPGHHLQQALQRENRDLPSFRRRFGVTAFVEGWGLYAERLGLEIGFYEDPYSDFGRLNSEMWRALRLVVDTGVHWLGWSSTEAVDYMLANSALSAGEARVEVARYVDNPGQALSYKIGEIMIRGLRARAEQRLGDRFDLPAFHDVVLANGSIPLNTLEDVVDTWIAELAAE